ncbi:MAG: hypothetical protein JWO03_1028 [Bacteroidetes bacterium]|nr:hypothetical protein [Bacteroidota bacterium]
MKILLIILALITGISVSAQIEADSTKPATEPEKVDAPALKKESIKELKQLRGNAVAKRVVDTTTHVLHTDTIHPHTIMYVSKQIMANAAFVFDKKFDSLIVTFQDHMIYSNMSLRPELSHLTDVTKRVRYSEVNDHKMFKVEKVNPDTTNFKYTYVRLQDTLIWKDYVGYKHKFTMKDQFTGTTFTVVLYECPEIKIDPEFAKYYFSELFFLKVPIKLHGGVIKALAEQRINDKPVMREELLLMRFDDEASWKGGVSFQTPMEKGYTFMLPDGPKKEKQYAKELIEHLTGRTDYPTVPFKEMFDHE